jgi:hypothetical protein
MGKNLFKYTAIFLFFSISYYAGAFLIEFNAYSESENIVVNWQTGDENNLKHFVVTRKMENVSYSDIATVDSKGSGSFYSYIDENVYKATGSVYTYQLKIVDNDGAVSYSNEMTVMSNVSGVKRTWGSIKALFR